MRLDKWLLAHFAGLSPLIARELSFPALRARRTRPSPTLDAARLAAFPDGGVRRPAARTDAAHAAVEGRRTDGFHLSRHPAIRRLSARRAVQAFPLCSTAFTLRRTTPSACGEGSQTLRKAISNLHERTRLKLELQRQELEATHDREQLRRQGDIVTANLHAITRGQTLLRAEDFMSEDLREVKFRSSRTSPRSRTPRGSTRTTPAPSMPSRCSRRSRRARSRRPIWAACSRSWPAPKMSAT